MSTIIATTIESPAIEVTPVALQGPELGRSEVAHSPARRVFEAEQSTTISQASRFLITFMILSSNLVQFISNSITFNGGQSIGKELGRLPDQTNWLAASYPLTQSAFVLISGRLGAIYGHQRLTLVGCLIFTIFSLINGFCTTYESFIAIRALSGIGGGLYMPNAVAMITVMVPPGQSRNLLLGCFAASPPIGGTLGALLIGVFTASVDWKWVFVLVAGLSAVSLAGLAYLLPHDQPVDEGGHIDYFGAFLGLSSLLLFNFVWNQAPSVGWSTPYEVACLIISVSLFCAFLLWEQRFAEEPIMPLSIFRAPTFTALIFVVLLTYMSGGITLWYSITWQQLARHSSVLQTGINFIPFGVASLLAVYLAAWLIPRVAAQWIMAVGILAALVANLLLATMPVQQTYWAQVFPATALMGFCPDFVYVAAQVIASNSVGRHQQGVASSLIGTLNLYGISLGLGFAGTIETELTKNSDRTVVDVRGYRATLYFGAALAAVSLILDFAFVRMPKDEREGWENGADEQAPVVGIELGATSSALERPNLA